LNRSHPDSLSLSNQGLISRAAVLCLITKTLLFLSSSTLKTSAASAATFTAIWWKGLGFDEESQKRFLLGSNKNGSAAVIPFWHRGRVQGLIRRQINSQPKYLYPSADAMPSGYRPLFTIFNGGIGWHLVEGIIDALSLAALDFNAVAVGGTGYSDSRCGG
jgi:hypothetical protein